MAIAISIEQFLSRQYTEFSKLFYSQRIWLLYIPCPRQHNSYNNPTFSLYNYRQDRNLNNDLLTRQPDRTAAMEQYLRAVIQAYNNHLISNDVFLEPNQ